MKRKIRFAVLLCIVLVLACAAFAACGDKDGDKGSGNGSGGGGATTYTVTLDANGGTFSENRTAIAVQVENAAALDDIDELPTRDEFVFDGWAKDREGNTLWNSATDTLTGNLTLYAVWTDAFIFTLSDDGSYYILSDIGPLSGDVEIPAVHNQKPVTIIGNGVFQDCTDITSVYIPDSITNIGYSVFSGCSSLTKITIPFVGQSEDATQYTYFAYLFGADSYRGSALVPISLEEVVVTGGTIGENAFFACSTLTSIKIPSGVTSIGEGAFRACYDLTRVNVPQSVTSIEGLAFDECRSLSVITLPQGITNIGGAAFGRCSSLSAITIPNTVTTIGYHAFEACSSLTIYCEATGKQSGWNSSWNYSSCPVVWNCKNNDKDSSGNAYSVIDGLRYSLKNGVATVVKQPLSISGNITIPSSVTYNDESYAVTSIAGGAFSGCSRLGDVTIAQSVTSIGAEAFAYCEGSTIYCEATSKPSGWNNSWNYSSCPVVWDCKNNDKDNYGYACPVIGGVRYRLKDGIATVVRHPTSISGSITIPSSVLYKDESYSVTSIGSGAFYDCYRLTSVCMPNTVAEIGNSAFRDCSGLISVVLPNGITSIEQSTFEGCKRLGSVTIPQSVTSIGYSAFDRCSSLTSITIPQGVTSIGGNAFSICTGLRNITIPQSVTVIGEEAFWSCSSLTSITIPSSVTSIGSSAFKDCSSLTSITIPSGVTRIEDSIFYGCSSLTSVELPSGVTNIGGYAFYGCSNLTSITIPDSVTYIGTQAFYNCSSLTSIRIPISVTEMGANAFQGCTNLTIYCEAESLQSNWFNNWNSSNCPVVWGYTGEEN